MFIVDADCHHRQPFKYLSNYVDGRYKRFLDGTDPEEKDDPFFSSKDGLDVSVFKRFGQQDTRKASSVRHGSARKRSEVSYPKEQGPEEIIAFLTDRVHDLGIRKSVLFPTQLLTVAMDPRADLELAVTKAYAQYVTDYFGNKHTDILNPLLVPLNSPDKAAELIDSYAKEKGIVGVTVPSATKRLAGTDYWNPIYEAAQDRGLPICMHATNYNGGGFLRDFEKFIGVFALSRPTTLATQVTSIVFGGVPEKYPKLRFGFIEGGVTWIPWLMQRLDSVYLMRKEEAPLLRKMPSEYIKEFFFTTQPLEYTTMTDLEYTFNKIGAENNLMYASDYPHWDFDVPSVVYDLPFLSDKSRKNIMGGNALRFFRITN